MASENSLPRFSCVEVFVEFPLKYFVRKKLGYNIIKTTSVDKNSKKKPISEKCSQILCRRLVELASRTSGVFSSAGKPFAVYSLAAISELWPASVDMFACKNQHKVDKPIYFRKIWKMIIETAINAVYISSLHSNVPWQRHHHSRELK